MTQQVPPTATEFEVSVFGRGFGEATALHIGDGRWLLVDSLVEADETPIALRYLKQLGVDVATAVDLIVATHWHDDHVQGISELYEACPAALLVVPQAMNSDEMNAFRREAQRYAIGTVSSGVDELEAIVSRQAAESRHEFRLAKINNRLLSVPAASLTHGLPVDIEALSPSDRDVAAFVRELAAQAAETTKGRWAMPFDENDVSVALWVSIGPHRVLLGADLTAYADQTRGWGAVLTSSAPLSGRAGIFKVPHHGSANAHHDGVWSTLLTQTPPPLAALTTWNRGRKLPRASDIERLRQKTSRAHITSGLGRRNRDRPKMVANKARERGVKLLSAADRAGHIRHRLDLATATPEWSVQLFDDAMTLDRFAERYADA
jgi:beta-lactamase superfamily II metal-dependent hydrolase